MKIQFNTDHNVSGNHRVSEYFSETISTELERFSDIVTRIEVHLSDENGDKSGPLDKRCLLEARIENRKPIAVTCHEASVEQAISGAIDKLKASLDSIVGKMAAH